MKTNIFPISVLSVILLIASITPAGSSIDLPANFPDLVATQSGQTAPGVFIGWLGFWTVDYYVVLDQSGYPLFYSKTEEMSYPGVMFNGLISAPAPKGYKLKDETFTVVDSFELVGNYSVDIHDFKVMPNGHALLLGTYPINMDMSKVVTGGRPDAQLTGNVIQEIDTNKNVVFEWRAIDHIPITDSFFNLTAKSIDYAHFNSVYIDPIDNNLLISFRTTCELMKVSRSTGEIIWRLGGKKNEFTFIGEHEENAPYYFVGQHSAWRLTNGNLLFFDNGNLQGAGTTESDRTYSRAVEYQIDEVNKTATLVWEFRHTPDISTPSGGRVQKLSNGNVIIDWGAAIPSGAPVVPFVTEVSPAGQVVYELRYATAKKGARLQKYIWNSPDLVKSDTFMKIESGKSYTSNEAGVIVTVNYLDGQTNNGLVVKKHVDAVRFPKYPGKAPQVLMDRVTMSVFGIDNITCDIAFNIEGMDFKDPNQMTVYHRPYEGHGMFTPIPGFYNTGDRKVEVLDARPGEFIFTYPDAQEIPLAPVLNAPSDLCTVSYVLPVTFEWTPKGLFQSFHLQVAKDAEFKDLVVDEPNLTAYKYVLETVEPFNTYFWRVRTNNYGGSSDWAVASFTAVAPAIKVTVPNGGEQWHKGLTYFIQWDYNMEDSVVVELYNGNFPVKTIATVSGVKAFEWEVDLSLRPGDNYYIKVRRAADGAISDTSDASFSVVQ